MTVSSAGKTFSATGWKVGWIVGPSALIQQVVGVHQWVSYSVPTMLQQALAVALKQVRSNDWSMYLGIKRADVMTVLAPYFQVSHYASWRRWSGDV